MSLQKIIIFASFLLYASVPAFADDSQSDLLSQVKFNISVLEADCDASMFLHSISLMKNGDVEDVQNFMEYRLDEFVCASWENQEQMNPTQKKRMMQALLKIKEHREKNPRATGIIVDPQKFYKHFEPYNASYALRADEILAGLK